VKRWELLVCVLVSFSVLEGIASPLYRNGMDLCCVHSLLEGAQGCDALFFQSHLKVLGE